MLMLFRRKLKFLVAMVAVIAAVAGLCGSASAAATSENTVDNGNGTFTFTQVVNASSTAPHYTVPGTGGYGVYSDAYADFGWAHYFPAYNTPGMLIQSVKLTIYAFDVDSDVPAGEFDAITGDGSWLNPQYLQGSTDVWSTTIFDVDASAVADGALDVWCDIDINGNGWLTTLDSSTLEITYAITNNEPPYSPTVSITPTGCTYNTDDLVVTVTGPDPADPDGDQVTYTYRWLVDTGTGSYVDDNFAGRGDHTGNTVPFSDISDGDKWKVEVTAVDQHGANSTKNTVAFATIGQCNTPPIANAGGDREVPAGVLFTLDGSGSADSDGSIASYLWEQYSDGVWNNIGSGVDLDVTLGTPGTYTIRLTVTDNLGGVDDDIAYITVVSVPVVVVTSAITSPADGAILTGAGATITGTAFADNGVAFVEVSTESGVWQTASGTSPWSFNWTLPGNGTYTIQSKATDILGNHETPGAGITVTVTNPPVIDSLTPSLVSPAGYGTQVTWTASASGGSGSYLYRFVRKGPDTAGLYPELQAWGASNTCDWTPAANQAGLNLIVVQVKNASGGVFVQLGEYYTVTAPASTPLAASSLTMSVGSPAAYGTPVTWTATATGGNGNYRYRFLRRGPDTGGAYVQMQALGTSRTFVWTPTAAQVGVNSIQVQVRDTTGTPAARLARPFSVSYQPIVINSVTSSPVGVGISGNPVTFTANVTGTGGPGSLLYTFYRMGPDTGGVYKLLRSQGGSSTCNWTPSVLQAGSHTIKATVINSAGGVAVSSTTTFSVPF